MWLILASCCGLALCLTRYPGLAIVLGGGLFLRTWRQRAVVVLPPLLLAVVGFIATTTMRPFLTPRGGIVLNVLHIPMATMDIVVGPLVLAGLVCLVVREYSLPATRILVGAAACYLLGLAGLTVANKFDPALDLRLFVPVGVILLTLLIGLTMRAVRSLAPYLLVGLAVYVAIATSRSWPELCSLTNKGLNAPRYTRSAITDLVLSLPPDVPVYSNNPSALWLMGRHSIDMPNTLAATYADNQSTNPSLNELRKTGGWLVWYEKGNSKYLQPKDFTSIMDVDSEGQVRYLQDSTGLAVKLRDPQ